MENAVVADLQSQLTDENAEVRAAAARGLGYVASESPAVVEPVIDTFTARLAHEDAPVRRDAAEALATIAPEAPAVVAPTVEELSACLVDGSDRCRAVFARTLDDIARAAPGKVAPHIDESVLQAVPNHMDAVREDLTELSKTGKHPCSGGSDGETSPFRNLDE